MKRFLAIVLMILLTANVIECSVFASTGGSTGIQELEQYGIITGDPDGNLRLDDNLTRAEAATVICRLIDFQISDIKNQIADVDNSHWAYEYVNIAVNYAFLDVSENNEFRPNDTISYNEFTKMIMDALGYQAEAEQMAEYPHGYVMSATKVGLFDNLELDMSAPVERYNMLVLINNALDIPKFGTGKNDVPLKTARMKFENANTDFSNEEIEAAKTVVENYYKAKQNKDREAILKTVTDWHNSSNVQFWADEVIEINDIRYENSILDREQYITNGRGKVNNTSIENVIVITVDFTVLDNGHSAYYKGEYKDYSMILIRDSKYGQWLIDDMGY